MKYSLLEQLNNLREKGAITEEEYQKEKEKILNSEFTSTNSSTAGNTFGLNTNSYCMFIHLSQLCGYFFPLAGLAVPIILWILNKDHNLVIDKHGKIVVNWIITSFIITAALGILSFLLIGIPLLIAFVVINFVLIIVGAMKANNGEFYKYPFMIEFIKVD